MQSPFHPAETTIFSNTLSTSLRVASAVRLSHSLVRLSGARSLSLCNGNMATQAQQFLTLISELTVVQVLDIAQACIVYPKTDSLGDDTPRVTLELCTEVTKPNQVKNFLGAVAAVEKNNELRALSAIDDLKMALEVLEKVREMLSIDTFDYIQFYRGGVDLLRIDCTKLRGDSMCGRSVYFEINDCRRRLISAVLSRNTSTLNPYVRDVALALGAALIANLLIPSISAMLSRLK